jgi:hypothetical protein
VRSLLTIPIAVAHYPTAAARCPIELTEQRLSKVQIDIHWGGFTCHDEGTPT